MITLGDNISRVIFRGELNGVGKTCCWLVSDLLEKLLFQEFCFDNPYLLRLHLFIKTFAVKSDRVGRAVIDRIMEWFIDWDNTASYIWVVNYFKQYILDNDLGDTIYVFGNKHRVEKTWSVKRNNMVKASGITNVAVVALKEDSQ